MAAGGAVVPVCSILNGNRSRKRMANAFFKCPQCGKRYSVKRITRNNYVCPNQDCALNVRLLIHGELSSTGKVSKVYGWVLQPGTVLKKKYKIIKMIGKGGFGATYLAEDESLFNQLRAIKETPLSICDSKEDEFLTVLNHPSIPRIYERFNHRKFHYSIMEYIEGISLEDIVRKTNGGLSEQEILNYARQICDVLDYIHSKNIVHRDLKPENILVRKDGSISLIDFGISKEYISGQGTRHLARAASYAYSSPEQYQGGKGNTDYKSDIYSFGAILYFLATGVEPKDALSRTTNKDISPAPAELNKTISKRLEKVITKAMKMKKGNRFNSVAEMQQTLFRNGKITAQKLCPYCSSIIEAGNRYCPNCGSSTKPVKKTSTPAFVFSSQKKAYTLKEFVEICYEDWNTAKLHLYKGDFEKWLKKSKNGKSLVRKARSIRKSVSNKDRGLNTFLKATNYYREPKISVNKSRLNLGKLKPGYSKNLVISVLNKGFGYLEGTVETKGHQINVKRESFTCLPDQKVRIPLTITHTLLSSGEKIQSFIELKSNGGSLSIPVSARFIGKAAKNAPVNKAIKIQITTGKKIVKHITITTRPLKKKEKRSITTLSDWLKVKPGILRRRKQRIKLVIDAKKLAIGEHIAQLLVRSNYFSKYFPIVIN
ncbi:protein kinase, partial [candidate division KSB1 bacterium]|nr:protein kinase [candidate division KSB1 bacterium]